MAPVKTKRHHTQKQKGTSGEVVTIGKDAREKGPVKKVQVIPKQRKRKKCLQ